MNQLPVSPAETKLRELAAQRILVLDGAMGTMIQALRLDEAGFRGARFDAWNRELRGNNDLLNLTRPQAIHDLHLTYLRAGADIIATNTFRSEERRVGKECRSRWSAYHYEITEK